METAAVPSRITNWIARPAPFNEWKRGSHVLFSEDRSVAERTTPEEDGADAIVFTAIPLSLGQVWQITILSTCRHQWTYAGLVSGV